MKRPADEPLQSAGQGPQGPAPQVTGRQGHPSSHLYVQIISIAKLALKNNVLGFMGNNMGRAVAWN